MSLTFRARSRAVRSFVVLVALATGLVLLPPLSAGADTGLDTGDRLAMMERTTDLGAAATVQQQDSEGGLSTCFTDPQGDTQRLSDDTAAPNRPRADILEHCVNFGPSLSLTVLVAEPTDPDEDGNWDGATFVGWFIDIDADGEGDFFVDYSLSRDRDLQTTVQDIREDTPSTTCSHPAAFTGERDAEDGRYAAVLIRPECVGGADEVRVSARMFYDHSGEGDESRTFYDTAPGGAAFTPAVDQRDRAEGRLAGRERMETSTEISEHQFPDGADVLYLARQDLFADAVAGGVLSDGPILLVPRCGTVAGFTREEVERVDPDQVIALGGPLAICDETLEEAAGDRPTDRLAGFDRIGTSIEISKREFPDDARFVFLARADVFADAVTGGVLTDGPILLVNPCGPADERVQAEIDRLDPDRVIALGGIHAICDETHDTAAGERTQQRLFGATRIETAIEISRFEFPETTRDVHISRADIFPDAVVGGVLTGGPILLVPRCIEDEEDFPDAVRREISRTSPERLIALGGVHAICEPVLDEAVNS